MLSAISREGQAYTFAIACDVCGKAVAPSDAAVCGCIAESFDGVGVHAVMMVHSQCIDNAYDLSPHKGTFAVLKSGFEVKGLLQK
jgi:hypothetical protein